MFKNSMGFVLLAVVSLFSQVVFAQTLAFPSAEGFGRYTMGGRGGRVIEVINLNDNGPGSFRQAVEVESGPRIVVFRVGGTIELESAVRVNNPYLTIAGQTAPGGGIMLKNFGVYINHGEVIVRHLRIHNSDEYNDWGVGVWNDNGISNMQNIILDHVSVSWAEDENFCVWGSLKNVTVQWCISAEGASGVTVGNGASDVTIHHNLFAHVYRRCPLANLSTDIINNVTYNGGQAPTQLHPVYAPIFANVVNNYFKEGISSINPIDGTGASSGEIWVLAYRNGWVNANGNDDENAMNSRLYISGNRARLWGSGADSDARIIRETRAYAQIGDSEQLDGVVITIPEVNAPHSFPPVKTTTAEQAYIDVLARAGATVPQRDAFDAHVVSDAQNSTGTRPWPFVRNWPVLAAGTAPTDSDHDGMPDSWETLQGLNSNNASDGPQDKDGDGYTNVEEYLNELAGDNATTGIVPFKLNPVFKTNVQPRGNQRPMDILGRAISENSKTSQRKTLLLELMDRKLGPK